MTTRTKGEALRRGLSVFMNALSAILVFYAVSLFFTKGGEGNMKVWNHQCFVFFTVDSNLLAALSSLILLAVQLRRKSIAQWALTAKFVGTTAVSVTFFTVVLFLGPATSYREMFSGSGLYLHLIVPVLEMASFCLLEHNRPLRFKESLWGVLPTLVYGALYFVMVIVIGQENGGWNDFYGFNRGGFWYVSCVVMLIATLGLCQLLRLANRAAGKTT